MDGRKEGGEKEDGCMNDKSVTGSEKSPFRYIPESPEMITEPLKVTILRRISSIQTPKPWHFKETMSTIYTHTHYTKYLNDKSQIQ